MIQRTNNNHNNKILT